MIWIFNAKLESLFDVLKCVHLRQCLQFDLEAWVTVTVRTRGARPTCPAWSSGMLASDWSILSILSSHWSSGLLGTPARRRRATSPSRPPTSPPTSAGWTSCPTPSMTSTSAPTPATPGTGEWQTVQDGGQGYIGHCCMGVKVCRHDFPSCFKVINE